MRRPLFSTAFAAPLACALLALTSASAAAEPTSFERGTVDQSFTTARPGSPTGLGYDTSFHAVGDRQANPPYLKRMVVHPPAGMRYDTSVPDQCTASDVELRLRGPNACPQGSMLGDGITTGVFMVPVADNLSDQFVFHEFWHVLHVFNNANEQIVLVEAEGYEVIRGRFRADGAIDWQLPTCFPAPPTGCVDDYIVQLTNSTFVPPYTEESPGGMRSYATTPPECPPSGRWETTVELFWSDGSYDSVVTPQPCSSKKKAT
jgi:hypothetical protein